jgi:excinuclease UvrABC ATPase subunit
MGPEAQRFISVIGAAEHNLKNTAVEIPRDSLTVITGISGSGKSSKHCGQSRRCVGHGLCSVR